MANKFLVERRTKTIWDISQFTEVGNITTPDDYKNFLHKDNFKANTAIGDVTTQMLNGGYITLRGYKGYQSPYVQISGDTPFKLKQWVWRNNPDQGNQGYAPTSYTLYGSNDNWATSVELEYFSASAPKDATTQFTWDVDWDYINSSYDNIGYFKSYRMQGGGYHTNGSDTKYGLSITLISFDAEYDKDGYDATTGIVTGCDKDNYITTNTNHIDFSKDFKIITKIKTPNEIAGRNYVFRANPSNVLFSLMYTDDRFQFAYPTLDISGYLTHNNLFFGPVEPNTEYTFTIIYKDGVMSVEEYGVSSDILYYSEALPTMDTLYLGAGSGDSFDIFLKDFKIYSEGNLVLDGNKQVEVPASFIYLLERRKNGAKNAYYILKGKEEEFKKPYYCEVEYLETTGTQYIDTGLPFHFQEDTATLRAELTASKEYQTIYGVNEKFDGAVQFFGVRQLSTQEKWQALNIALSFPAFVLNKKFTLQISRVDTTFFQYDGEARVAGATNNIKDTTHNAFVFALNNMGSTAYHCIGKIYAFQHKRAGVLVRDLIPVLDLDMTPCMYDKVSGQLFYNAGTGEFLYGREIHQVEYLESTGTQYIDTGITQNSNIKAKLSIYPTVINKFIFGSRVSSGTDGFGIFMHSNNGGSWYSFFSSANAMISGFEVNKKYDIEFSKDGFIVNNNLLEGSYAKEFTGTLNMYLFAMNSNGAVDNRLFIGKIYSTKLYNNNVLIRDFIPAVDENGVGFMFDRVTHTIFDNAGTGVFNYPPVELEYLESGGDSHIDTGIKPTDEYGYHIRNTYRYGGGEQCAIGAMDAGNRFVGPYTGGIQISGGWGSFVGFFKNSYTFEDDTIWDVYCNYKNDRQIIVNDEFLKDLTDIHITGEISNTIYLFARHYGNNITKMSGRIYSAEITKGSDVIAHFIPCFKDGQVGMWDKVNNILYTNAGTGSFVAGKIVEKQI